MEAVRNQENSSQSPVNCQMTKEPYKDSQRCERENKKVSIEAILPCLLFCDFVEVMVDRKKFKLRGDLTGA